MTVRQRIAAVLAAAAAALAVGTYATIDEALVAENRELSVPVTCYEFRRELTDIEEIEWFVAASDAWIQREGNPPLHTDGDRIIGDCAGGECEVTTSCAPYSYFFETSSSVGGFRLAKARGHPYFAGSWEELATEESGLTFWGSRGEVQAACIASPLTAGQCWQLMSQLDDCLLRSDGQLCRYGRLYGPGVGGVNTDGSPATCSPQAGDEWVSCSDLTKGPGWAVRNRSAPLPERLDFGGGGGEGSGG